MSARAMGRARSLATLAAALLLASCAETAITWRAADRYPPLAPDADVSLYVRASAPKPLHAALLERGAVEVVAFPEGERVAEIAAREAAWLSWDDIIADVKARARALGADGAMGTGALSSAPAEHVLYFQLVRAGALDRH